MARSQDRTEKPTERRKREARREGRVAKSQEVGVAVSLLGLVFSLRYLAPGAARAMAEHTRRIIASSAGGTLTPEVGASVVSVFLVVLGPFLVVAVTLGLVGGVGQVGITFAPKALQPKLSNLSPKKGLQRFKPSVAGWELVRGLLKLGLLVAIIWGPLTTWMRNLGRPMGLGTALGDVADQVWTVVWRATLLAVLIAAADYGVNRFRTGRELKLTKQELKEEMKHAEGDPMVKAARRRRASEMSRNRMIADVATADVVVTNPTHFAVALRYTKGEPSPRVVAKGVNKLAARIRNEAYRNGVPVLENKPLARALYRRVKVGRHVPTALFEAVAAVLAVAYRRRGRRAA